jgi:hypothetical protein
VRVDEADLKVGLVEVGVGAEREPVLPDRLEVRLTDAKGALLYYGSINANTDATSSSVTIPAGLALGSYTLSLYGENRNAAYTTDYATGTPFTQTITITTPTVTSVTVSPATASVAKGGTQSFSATVNGTNNPAQTVTWGVTGKASSTTDISNSGVLTVGSDETATSLTVTATSTVDTAQSGTAAVTVTDPTPPGPNPDPIQYPITRGQNGEWAKGSNKGLSFTADGDYSKFTGVWVDGYPISSDKYTSESGSTVVTLEASYLSTLSVGRRTLRVNFSDGYAQTNFTIGSNPDIPQTGDNSTPTLWLGIALMAGARLAASIVLKRKRQN